MAMLNNQRVNHGKHSVEVDASVLILWMDNILTMYFHTLTIRIFMINQVIKFHGSSHQQPDGILMGCFAIASSSRDHACDFLVGMVVFRLMSRVKTPPNVS